MTGIQAGVWRHADGPHYLVLGVATDANNIHPRSELQVVYVSLEGWGRPGSRLRHRSLSEFLDRFTPEDSDFRAAVGLPASTS